MKKDDVMSFQEFVKNKFYNEIATVVTNYVLEHPEYLSGGFYNRYFNCEYSDHDVRSVIITDKPGTSFDYDVIVEAYFDISWSSNYDEDSCSKSVWLILHCHGDLAERPFIWHCERIERCDKYSKNRKDLSNGFVPYIRRNEYDSVATKILEKYLPENLNNPVRLDVEILLSKMGLRVEYRKIRCDKSICGQIYFADCDNTFVGKVTAGSVVVDPYLFFQCGLGCEQFTIAHECVHWVLHRKVFLFQKLLNDSLTSIDCAESGSSLMAGNPDIWRIIEVQANAIAARLLMPANSFRIKLEEYVADLRNGGSLSRLDLMPRVLELVAWFFGVSKLAAKIRAVELGVAEATGCFEWVDGHYVEPYIAILDVVSKKLTYTIPVLDMACEIMAKPELKAAVEQGKLVYVDSHLVYRDKRYIRKTDRGLCLTEYAKMNMAECCVAFSVKVKDSVWGECSYGWLNRDKNAIQGISFEYEDGIKRLAEAAALDNLANEKEYRELEQSLGNNQGENFRLIGEFKRQRKSEFTAEADIDPKTLRGWLGGAHEANKNSFVRMCLALHLPYNITQHLLRVQGFVLQTQKHEDFMFYFALSTLYLEDVDKVQEFLAAKGVVL